MLLDELASRARQARRTASVAPQESCSSARPVSAPALPGAGQAAGAAQPPSPARSDQSSAATPARGAHRPGGRPFAERQHGDGLGLRDGTQPAAAVPSAVENLAAGWVKPRDSVAVVHVSACTAGGRRAVVASKQGASGTEPDKQGRLLGVGRPAGVWHPGRDTWATWQRLLSLVAAETRGRAGCAQGNPGLRLWAGCVAGAGVAALAVSLAARRRRLADMLAALAALIRIYTTSLRRLK